MADNYLENKMEEYRRGKTATGKYSRRPAQGYLALKMAGLRALLAGPVTSQADACVRKLVVSGCKVAFFDQRQGNEYAQKTGALFLPSQNLTEAFSQTLERWEKVDILLLTDYVEPEIVDAFRREGVNRVIGIGPSFTPEVCDIVLDLIDSEDSAVANLCAVLCHPSTYSIRHIFYSCSGSCAGE